MAWVEFRLVMISIIFMFILNLLVIGLIDSSAVEQYDRQEIINELTQELGAVAGFFTTALLNIGITMFSLFGVDFTVFVAEVPLIITNGLILYNIIAVTTLIFYLVRILWIGG